MKILLLFILLMCITFQKIENNTLEKTLKPVIIVKKASFQIAFNELMKNEGFWAHENLDMGGETYCGIPRKWNNGWIGWKYIDLYKRTHTLHNNDSIPGIIKWYVVDYYVQLWIDYSLLDLEDQDIANYILDTKVNIYYGGILIKKTINQMGYNIPVDNEIDKETIKCINSLPKWEFLAKLLSNRMMVYSKIVQKYPNQSIWLHHWLYRSSIKS